MIRRPERNIPVWGEYDVIVCGGGIAGVAAALAAARSGVKTCLIEKYAGLGGLATLGLIVVYLPLCDGRGRQVSFGIAEELLKAPMKYSSCKPKGAWHSKDSATREELAEKRYELVFDPGPMALALERLVCDAGVELVYDSVIVDVIRNYEGAITHLVLENKSGCGALAAKTVIDCTGDADICHMCGESVEVYPDNTRSAWYYAIDEDRRISLELAVDYWSEEKTSDKPRFDGTDWRQVTAQIVESRKYIIERLAADNRKRSEKGQVELSSFYVPFFHSFRMTRHLVSDYVITSDDVHRWHNDAVGIFPDWRKAGRVYSLPLRSILAVNTPNLAAAGRCISASGDSWDVTRVIPVCAVSGEAAGIVTAMAASDGCALRSVPVEKVQKELKARGVLLDKALVENGD
ncbi:MAG: FAD-dependent oxidoreductase [Lentisphaerae bacterium]|nr:FAD-dependent oxidoreductase [Lentisphaerota bacterium]